MTAHNPYLTSERIRDGSQMFHSGYMDSDSNSAFGRPGKRGGAKRRINDGTSEIEINKALNTYLNRTGAGDYNLPKLTGDKIIESNRKN